MKREDTSDNSTDTSMFLGGGARQHFRGRRRDREFHSIPKLAKRSNLSDRRGICQKPKVGLQGLYLGWKRCFIVAVQSVASEQECW